MNTAKFGELMQRLKAGLIQGLLIMMILSWLVITSTVVKPAAAQQPTVDIPTVTGTPFGPMVQVNQDQDQPINVRAGPSQDYPVVGLLEVGEKAPALGRSIGGDWIEIQYPVVNGGVGWVYAYLVSLSGGDLPVVVPPPTVTPKVTPTIDPTLASQYLVNVGPTRLPTFTQPPPINIPTYAATDGSSMTSGLPMGFIIIGLGVLGIFGLIISVFRGR